MKVSVQNLGDDPRRKMPRHVTDAVTCPLGEILDLSGSGMRIMFKGRCSIKVGQSVPIKLKTPHGTVMVAITAKWRRRTGLLGGYQIGFEFMGIKPAQSVALATIARFGFVAPEGVQKASSKEAPKLDQPSSIEATLVLAQYYDCLGLDDQATSEDIKHAYRQLARQYHPDVASGEENQRKFVELREAYDLLNDHHRRAG